MHEHVIKKLLFSGKINYTIVFQQCTARKNVRSMSYKLRSVSREVFTHELYRYARNQYMLYVLTHF